MFNLWINDNNFFDNNFYEFDFFENVINQNSLELYISNSLAQFNNIPINVLSNLTYMYCYHKKINLKDKVRWENNFIGDICLYLLENARYLQAYFRDVNSEIKKGGSNDKTDTKVTTYGSTNTNKDISNGQTDTINASTTQGESSSEELGDTLTILNNQTTSTNYLATKNDESFSKGSVNKDNNISTDESKNNSVNINVGNNNTLGVSKDIFKSKNQDYLGALDIAKKESEFNFNKWVEDYKQLLDNYFLIDGGGQYA